MIVSEQHYKKIIHEKMLEIQQAHFSQTGKLLNNRTAWNDAKREIAACFEIEPVPVRDKRNQQIVDANRTPLYTGQTITSCLKQGAHTTGLWRDISVLYLDHGDWLITRTD